MWKNKLKHFETQLKLGFSRETQFLESIQIQSNVYTKTPGWLENKIRGKVMRGSLIQSWVPLGRPKDSIDVSEWEWDNEVEEVHGKRRMNPKLVLKPRKTICVWSLSGSISIKNHKAQIQSPKLLGKTVNET